MMIAYTMATFDEPVAPLAALTALEEMAIAALASLEAGDLDELMCILEARQSIMDGTASLPRHNAEDPAQLAAQAAALQKADTRLALALQSFRDSIETDLEAMDSGEAARSAYFNRRRAPGQLDIRR